MSESFKPLRCVCGGTTFRCVDAMGAPCSSRDDYWFGDEQCLSCGTIFINADIMLAIDGYGCDMGRVPDGLLTLSYRVEVGPDVRCEPTPDGYARYWASGYPEFVVTDYTGEPTAAIETIEEYVAARRGGMDRDAAQRLTCWED